MAFKQQNDFDLAALVSFRIPQSVRETIQAKAKNEQKTISEVLRTETMQLFKQKKA